MSGLLDEILLKIFSEFDAKTLLICSCVNKHWNKLSKCQSIWKKCVLRKWPSQFWLYGKAACHELNWWKVYQDLHQYSWYSPDDMKYFVSCSTLENELISACLRKAMVEKINSIKKKWLQAHVLDHDGNMISRHFDQNLELYYNTQALEWVFLDKRRGYMDTLFSKTKKQKVLNQSYFIRPYQVIPSCLLMYRWLAVFRSVATAESGLTFYRIWRFRLKHKETGFIFEFCDWKAAMSCTFSNGCPNIRMFKEDALELLQVLTHPHFIMHPNGLHPRIEKTFLYAIHASAGGCVNMFSRSREKPLLKRRKRPLTPTLSSGTSFIFTKQIHEQTYFQDIDERLERWRARRRISLRSHITSNPVSLESQIGAQLPSTESLSRGSSYSNLTSEADSATDESQREFNTSDCDSEFNFLESGYVTNCEYFISDSHNFETVEEQHSQQASVADNWLFTNKHCLEKIPVLYDIDDKTWCIQSQRGYVFPTVLLPQHSTRDEDNGEGQLAKVIRLDDNEQNIQAGVENLHLHIPPKIKSPPMSPPPMISPSLYNNLYSGAVEPIPSALALYRLVCLFELNSSMYLCDNEDSVWKISMLHKETGGVIHFEDFNGVFQVYVSMNEIQPLLIQDGTVEGIGDNMFLLSDFRVSIRELLNLLMSENFCHPYGTIAGAVA